LADVRDDGIPKRVELSPKGIQRIRLVPLYSGANFERYGLESLCATAEFIYELRILNPDGPRYRSGVFGLSCSGIFQLKGVFDSVRLLSVKLCAADILCAAPVVDIWT
jgi:hypothetical protein